MKSSPSDFFDAFVTKVNCVLAVPKKEACVDRLVEFIAKFATQPSLTEEFIPKLLT